MREKLYLGRENVNKEDIIEILKGTVLKIKSGMA
jgi:hypothetical protein